MVVLGIETSCDETAAALVTADRRILSNVIHSQIEEHQPYGGVVPEISARNHLIYIENIIEKALFEAKCDMSHVDAIAVTSGPGLIGGVMVGVMVAKGLAASLNKPFIAVNHLEGHALVVRLTNDVPFPYLLMLMSGGHCQFVIVRGLGDYQVLGRTLDDAAGEAFDKVAKCLGLDYPGGPQVEAWALKGNAKRFLLPRPLKGRQGCDFSFAGLKTAVRHYVDSGEIKTDQDRSDLCAAFQQAVADCMMDRLTNALGEISQEIHHIVLSGGVAANQFLRTKLQKICEEKGKIFVAPPVQLCTDNGVMIAWAGLERFVSGQHSSLTIAPRPRWPLDSID